MSESVPPVEPRRLIIQGDALAWMDANPAEEGMSVVTSLPDVSERPGSSDQWSFEGWKTWFGNSVRRIVRWIPESGVAIFFQSDIRRQGVWVDKGYLVMRAAEEEAAPLLWHKIVCRKPPGTIALGRASYSHMLCVARGVRAAPMRPGPDVLPDAGVMNWSRAMGAEASRVACRYLLEETATRTVVDPFCGKGMVLAVANGMGLDAVGVELSAKRCRAARALVIAGTALAMMSLACAPAASAPSTSDGLRGAPAPATAAEPLLALRLDQVRRLRDALQSMSRDDPTRESALSQLADALVALAALHFDAAVADDAGVTRLAAPRDLRARRDAGGEAELSEREAASELETEEPVASSALRDEAAMAALSPRARAHVLAFDRVAAEACERLREIAYASTTRPAEARHAHARRARFLAVLGQQTEAQRDWYAVVKTPTRDVLAVEGWLFFADVFGKNGKNAELAVAMKNAREAAADPRGATLVDHACLLLHAKFPHDLASSCGR